MNLPSDSLPPVEPLPAATPAHAVEAPELAAWKSALREDFETWLASIDEVPPAADHPDDADRDEDPGDEPDLYSFHAQLTAATAESRKANRRTAEAMSQWGETLARFESGLQPLRETAAQLVAAQPKAGQMSRGHCLMLVELLERMHRLARAFTTPPPVHRSWWGAAAGDAAWRTTWTAQREGLNILVGHIECLLQKEGVTPIATLGQPFDPAVMLAVAVEIDASRPPQTVVEETAAGYTRHGELLRAAQVKVSRLS